MLDLFKVAPECVRWELSEARGGRYRLTVYHAGGTVVESFRTKDTAIRRVHRLEEVLLRALEHDFRQERSSHEARTDDSHHR